MISKYCYSYSPRTHPNLTFKGCTETTTLPNAGKNTDDLCVHETYFFRNIDTLNYTTDYIKKVFPNGTNIAEFASSTGEEAYSIAMLLKDSNKDKKYKIFGYDITPRIIEQMDSRLYEITPNKSETFLVSDYHTQSREQENLKKIFYDHFEKIPKEWQYFEYSPKNIKKLLLKLDSSKNEIEKTALKYMISYSKIPIQDKWGQFFIPKKDVFKDVVSFETKDISELGEKYELNENTGVVFFKNAFYHIIGFGSYKENRPVDLALANKVTEEINKNLDKNGIFVVGSLIRDHLYNEKSQTRIIKQDNKDIEVCDSTEFHKMLRKNGFEPVFYECIKDECIGRFIRPVYLPSVWKKTREI